MVPAGGVAFGQNLALFLLNPSDENRLLAPTERVDNSAQMLHALELAENHLRKTDAKLTMGVQRCVAELREWKVLQLPQRSINRYLFRSHLPQQTPKRPLFHASLEPQLAQERSETSAFRHQNQ